MSGCLRAVVATAFVLGAVSGVPAADVAAPISKAAWPSPSWTGAYIGLNGGYAWQDRPVSLNMNDDAAINGISLVRSLSIPHKIDGGFAGFQAGYNWQYASRWLAGIEADFQFGKIGGTPSLPLVTSGGGVPGVANFDEGVEWFGTVRGRLGFLATDNMLLYGTGGLAYGRVDQAADFRTRFAILTSTPGYSFSCAGGGNVCFAGNSSQIQFGWTLGGGAEFTLWNNVTLKTEYLYVNLGHGSVTMTALATQFANLVPSSMTIESGDVDLHVVRVGLNARF
ncbi:MAG: outer membrane protein [Pseudorhodoplanes sp.]